MLLGPVLIALEFFRIVMFYFGLTKLLILRNIVPVSSASR